MGNALKTAASGAGASLSKVSAEATKADAALDKVGDSAKQAASGLDSIDKRATKVGAALGTAVATLSRFGAQAENQRRQVQGIEKAYGSAADQILEFTESVQDSTKFSNEDAREAAQIAATLAQNYGFTADEVEKLITVSGDLATVHGTTLSDAVQRTAAAMRGEAESAEALGLTLNQQAIDRDNVTLSMSNEEAAHFRLNALLEQAAYAEGAAGEAAATAAGQAAQFANNIQDITTNIGSALGPVAGVTAGFADLALILPVAGAGAGKLIAGLSQAQGKMASLASGAASLVGAINPIGVAVGLAAVAAGVLIKKWTDNEAANAALSASYDELASAIRETQSAQQQLASNDIRFDFNIADQTKALADLGRITTDVFGTISTSTLAGTQEMQAAFDELTLNTEEQTQANRLLGESYKNVAADGMNSLIAAMDKLETATESFAVSGDTTLSALNELNDALSYNGDGAEVVDAAVQRLNDAYADGNITAKEYADGLAYLNDHMAEIISGAKGAASATEELTEAQKLAARADVIDGLEGQSARYNALAESIAKANEAAIAPALASGAGFGLNLDDAAREEIAAYGESLNEAATQAAETAAALRDQLTPALDGASGGFAGLAEPGEDVLDVLARIAPTVDNVGGSLLRLSDGLNDAAQGMDSVLGTFEAIDALGARASQAGDIASNLVGEPGTWATIDDLLANGAISLDQYNAALEAGYAIQTRAAGVEEDLNVIRANQIPLLAEQAASYGAYIDRLSEASAAEQQQALYLMDSANQAKLAASYSTAYAASLGEIPTDVATEIIADGAQADPILADILEKYGLIEVGADGTVTVNFPDAATLDDVNDTLNNLNDTVVAVGIALTGDTELNKHLSDADARMVELDGKTATVTTTANDDATPRVQAASDAVDEFDGKTATATLTLETTDLGIGSAANAALERIEGEASASKTVSVAIEAVDNASPVIARVMQAASALATIDGSVELSAEDQASSAVAQAMAAVSAFGDLRPVAELSANDSSGGTVAQAMQAANAFATDYTAQLAATDGASSPIAQAMAAGNAFATTYTGTLNVSDNASATINSAQDSGTQFASTYQATLQAQDNASSVIAQAMAAVTALDGMTATVYVNAVDNSGGALQKKHGGVIQPAVRIPHAKNGRVVQVGEAGPENVILPYGAMVQPHPASLNQQASPDKLIQDDPKYKKPLDAPKVDLKAAYKKGGDSAKAFFDGLYAEANQRVKDQQDEIATTVYGSEEEADKALADLRKFARERDRIGKQREKAKDFDKEQKAAEKAATKIEKSFDDTTKAATKAGKASGKAIEDGISDGTDAASELLSKFGLSLESLDNTKTEPEIGADTSAADKSISDVGSDLKNLDGETASVKVKVDDSEWRAFVDEVATTELKADVKVTKSEKSSSGKMLGGGIYSESLEANVPAAALGRVVQVGERGPEAVILPYGAMVTPHPASAARFAQEPAPRGNISIYGNVNLYPPNSNVYAALQAQLTDR